MKKAILCASLIICITYGLREIWYRPLFKRPPVLEINTLLPAKINSLILQGSDIALKRFLCVEDDKMLAFPEGKNISWSDWRSRHEINFNGVPKWEKIFAEEKWLLFKKRSSICFFNSGSEFSLFDRFLSHTYPGITGKSEKKLKIAFLGDSLTSGLFSSNTGNGYALLVHKKIGEQPQAQTLGVVKIKLVDFNRNNINSFLKQPLDVIVIELGTNDYGAVPIPEFSAGYESLIRIIQGIHPKSKIVCLGVWRGYKGYKYDQIILNLSEKYHSQFVYMGDLFEKEELHSTSGAKTPWGKADSFHPSDQGHKEIAERLLSAITLILNSEKHFLNE